MPYLCDVAAFRSYFREKRIKPIDDLTTAVLDLITLLRKLTGKPQSLRCLYHWIRVIAR